MTALIETGPFSEGDRDFYAAIGWALAQWQEVEHQLARLERHLVGEEAGRSGVRPISGLQQQLANVDAGMRRVLDDDELARWGEVARRLRDKLADREQLLCFRIVATDPIESRDGFRLHVRPEPGLGGPDWRAPRYSTRQLMDWGQAFNYLAVELAEMAERLTGGASA